MERSREGRMGGVTKVGDPSYESSGPKVGNPKKKKRAAGLKITLPFATQTRHRDSDFPLRRFLQILIF